MENITQLFTYKYYKKQFTGWHKLQTLLFFIVTFALLYGLDTIVLSSPRPFIDALSATIGFTGAFLCVRQFSAQYYFWFTQGIMSIVLWLVTAIDGHAV